jgi:Fe-S oxidoreductase
MKRDLPSFADETFLKWFKKRAKNPSKRVVVLLVDLYTNYNEPEVGKNAVKVLESMGYQVVVPNMLEYGRIQISNGLLDKAKELAENVVNTLYQFVDYKVPLVGLEPSEILTLRDEYLDIVDDEFLRKATRLASVSFTFEEFISLKKELLPDHKQKGKVVLHGHCHAKSMIGNNPTISALEAAGYEVDELDTGCCGMAGAFGYEKDKYNLSMEIGGQRLFPELRTLGLDRNICAPGFSCRHQIKDGTGRVALHPATLIAENINID